MESKDTIKWKETEKVLERLFCEGIEILGGEPLKFESNQSRGNPDRLAILPGGTTVYAEIKTTGKAPSRAQWLKINRFRELGAKVFVIDDGMTLVDALDSVELISWIHTSSKKLLDFRQYRIKIIKKYERLQG